MLKLVKLPPNELVHLGMARTFQKNNLFGDLTVKENLHLALTALKPYRYQLFKPLSSYADLKKKRMN